MELPNELVLLIGVTVTGFVSWLVVEGFKGIGEAFGHDFSAFSKVVAGIVSVSAVSAIVGVFNAALVLVPVEYQSITAQVLALIVSLFAAMGIQRRVKQSQV
jgi:uncharacterized membrane protein YiaA